MADLNPLIRLHKHELDEKRRVLGELYGDLALLERDRRELERQFDKEKEAVAQTGDIHFTFSGYVDSVRKKREAFDKAEAVLEKNIEAAKHDLMETFSELKKYEMTQAERERLAEEERRFKEDQAMDAIGLEGFRRKTDSE
jgi:flagellar protein FliJ